MTGLDDAAYLTWLQQECGYRDVRPIGNGRWVAISPLMFTHAIIIGAMGDRLGYADRWCYSDYRSALAALDAWDGTGEPKGWHRHPGSGRRVDARGAEYVEL
jgi:hypothetical protein